MSTATESRKDSRDLSPYSARRALTERLNQHQDGGRASSARKAADSREEDSPRPPPRERRVRSRSPPSRARRKEGVELPRDRSKGGQSKEASTEALPLRDRDGSPEPYRKPRQDSEERNRRPSKSKERRRDKDRREADRRHRDKDDEQSDGERQRERKERRGDHFSDSDRPQRERKRDRNRRDRSRSPDNDERRERRRERHHRHRSGSRDRRRDRSRSKHRRSRSPPPYRSLKRRSPSASPPLKRRKRTRSPSRSRSPSRRSRKPLPDQEVSFRGLDDSAKPPSKYGGAPPNREKPNMKPTGLLAKAANKVEGTKISLKYHEPAEARKPSPSQQWRLFVFKGDDVVDTIELWQKSCWLLGRSAEVVDYVLEHPSSSGQHAVVQFRYTQKTVEDEYGVKKQKGKVKPYIIDLESSNGTELNGERVETSRYFELRDKDILKFAGSEREYVVMLPPPEK